ncbi:MAG: alkaline phosphatase, partial [Thermoanaerobaculia bacterium]
ALVRFDDAVAAAAAIAARNGETLVVVLGDHATGGLSIDSRSSAGELALSWASGGHTGEPVPVFAYGPPSAAARFGGMHDNTEIPHLVAAALGLEFPPPASTR